MTATPVIPFPTPAPAPRYAMSLDLAMINMPRADGFIIQCHRDRGEIASEDCRVVLRKFTERLPYRAHVIVELTTGGVLDIPLDVWPFWLESDRAVEGLAERGGRV